MTKKKLEPICILHHNLFIINNAKRKYESFVKLITTSLKLVVCFISRNVNTKIHLFVCTYVRIKNFHLDGLWENMNNLWVYDPIILISMITLNHGRNTVCQKARLIISFFRNAHCMFIVLEWHSLFYVIHSSKM